MNTKFLNDLIDALLNVKDREDMKIFLKGLLTPQEIEEISVRIQIIKMLKKGIPQHSIAKKLGIGVATVTRGSKEIKMGRFKQIK